MFKWPCTVEIDDWFGDVNWEWERDVGIILIPTAKGADTGHKALMPGVSGNHHPCTH
jgi:hypothetical protein